MSEDKPLEDLLSEKDDLTLFRDEMHQLMMALSDKFETRLQEMEKAVDNVEKQIATLIVGYGEQAVFMEALIAQINFASPDAQKAFTDNVSENRKKMFQVMKEGASGILGPENQDLASAIEDVAGQKLFDSNE
jgi:hypothetical protein